ncbi:Nif3-like dinuclear metal center hexameric protein [Mycoplasmopsis iners]|uniref:Nif3-like dinuclear metal center hexameric protein n=1 Tax=Mycoplasmopsis iners TaxID=76630 RepID=UPI0004979CF5|nr:Nif3-like dinuclear metal center hexameric protein [Mycoplasmopsis iners]
MKVRKLTDYLFSLYPLQNKEIWDPSGFSVKFNQAERLRGVVSAIDLTDKVLNKALEIDANLILVHHPFKFLKTWKDEDLQAPYKKQILEKLKQHRIHVLAFHTNFDNAPFGTSKRIVEFLGLINYLKQHDNPYAGVIEYKTNLNELVALIKNKFGFQALRTNLPKDLWNNEISKIAILSGSGANVEINNLKNEGFDLIITSDIKWSDWINYQQTKTNILEIPHLDEEVFAQVIYNDVVNFIPKKHPMPVEIVKLEEPYQNI